MKKGIKIFLVLLCVIFIAAASLAVWQWKNIKSIYVGVSESSEEISKRRNDNQKSLAQEINDYLDGEIREMTTEEKKQIEEGSATVDEIYLKIYQEAYEKAKEEKNVKSASEPSKEGSEEKKTTGDKKTTGNKEVVTDEDKDSENKKSADKDEKNNGVKTYHNKNTQPLATKDEIVSKYVAQLYSLQGKYTAMADATVAEGKSYYLSLRRSKTDGASARAEVIRKYTPVVRSVQSQCDAEVASLIANLENELKAIGENTDITGTIRAAYENEKQLKISYYSGQYLK